MIFTIKKVFIVSATLSAAMPMVAQTIDVIEEKVVIQAPLDKPANKEKSAKYKISSGDSLLIEVLEDPSLNRNLLVGPDGRVTLPLSGTFNVSGLTLEEVKQKMTDMMRDNFALEPNVSVSLLNSQSTSGQSFEDINVFMLGAVGRTGQLSVPEGTTLLELIALAGGFTQFAATKRIQLRRVGVDNKEKIYIFDYNDIEKGKSTVGLTEIKEGDVILAPQRGLFEL